MYDNLPPIIKTAEAAKLLSACLGEKKLKNYKNHEGLGTQTKL
jgi:hypothetical protein